MKFTGTPMKAVKRTLAQRVAALEREVLRAHSFDHMPLCDRHNELAHQFYKLAEHFGLYWNAASSIPIKEEWRLLKKPWWKR